jgi:DNA topoisomerase-1
VSGKAIVVKDGRFGPYVTDGETNATLRKGDDPTSITAERAQELLAEKRARGPVTRKRAVAKTTAKKTTAKKTTAKKTAAKTAAKTAVAKTAVKTTTAKSTASKSAAAKKTAARTTT